MILAKIQEMAANAAPIGSTIKFDLGGNIIHLDGTGDSNIVSQEDNEADCTISMEASDFEAMMSGDLNPMMAFMSGKIKIDGDMSVAMQLQSLFG
ncbi:MAG: SCP2 sterol-binding domain-containing protein [Saprospiraceae bacterium]